MILTHGLDEDSANDSPKNLAKDRSGISSKTAKKAGDADITLKNKGSVDQLRESDTGLNFEIEDYFAPQDNQFIQLLGLPEVTVETLFMMYKDKDKSIGKIMNE